MRRTAVVLATLVLGLTLVGCGDVNKGSAFAAEFQAFLDDRDNLASAEASGQNPLPWSGTGTVTIELVDGLGDDEILDEVAAITAHEVDNQVGYDLEVRFPAETVGGDAATAAFQLRVPGPAPDDPALRDQVARRLDEARDLVGHGLGPTEASATASGHRLRSQGDAAAVATAICADPGLAPVLEDSLAVEGPSPDGTVPEGTLQDDESPDSPGSLVTLDGEGDCGWLADVAEVLALAGAGGPVTSYSASYAAYDESPQLRVTLASGGTADLSAAEARAAELGVELVLSSA